MRFNPCASESENLKIVWWTILWLLRNSPHTHIKHIEDCASVAYKNLCIIHINSIQSLLLIKVASHLKVHVFTFIYNIIIGTTVRIRNVVFKVESLTEKLDFFGGSCALSLCRTFVYLWSQCVDKIYRPEYGHKISTFNLLFFIINPIIFQWTKNLI